MVRLDGGATVYVTRCDACGAGDTHTAAELDASEAPVCFECFANAPDELDDRQAAALARLASVPRLDPDRPWAEDLDVQAWAAEHPDGSTLEEVARAFGVTPQRAQQIEAAALRKIRGALEDASFDAAHIAGVLRAERE
jgi:hypothetical protein